MSMLQNAVESIQIGMEDFHEEDDRRVLSAIRNLYAGILLLFKYKLQQLSPEGSDEALLKTKIMPITNPATGDVVWIGKGRKTVEVHDIIDRLDSLGVKGVDWKLLKNLQDIRNDIEHYYSQLPVERMKEAIANALHLITQFCEPHLDGRPVDILGQECWDLMLSVTAVFEAELTACQLNLNSVAWPFEEVRESIDSMVCPECESRLVKAIDPAAINDSIRFICSSCQAESLYSSVVGPAVSARMAGRNHWRVKDGGEPATCTCPECGEDALLVDEGECAACFYELEYSSCSWCEEPLSIEERLYSEGVCSYCQYRYDKIMDE
ncbi:hypothetical protein [Pseudomonas tohonis]|uniref:hypothetical protein n=1 Tax=Pseudomonas tohonis TaxID=2725477 RepID=UPI001F1D4726|nr:hypothetical protein [Pseudomonas tohonis]